MLIISKFHDYYDTAIAYGIDKECVYTRKTENITNNKYRRTHETIYNSKDYEHILTNHVIGFCGVIHRGTKVIQKSNYNTTEQTFAFYSADSLISYLKEHNIGLTQKRFRWSWISRDNYQSEAGIKYRFDKEISKDLYDIFTEYRTPCFVWTGEDTFINPCLKEYKFGKVKDASTAFQEIHQYLAGVLGQEKDIIIDPPDKAKVKIHGFDKWSFRTMPGDSRKSNKKSKKKS